MHEQGEQRLKEAGQSGVWAILPSALPGVLARLQGHAESADVPAAATTTASRPGSSVGVKGNIAFLPLFGVLTQHGGFGEDGTSTELFCQALRMAMGRQDVGAVVIVVDSPGGSVFGVEELARRVFSFCGQGKPLIAFVDSMAASAAYWIASQAEEVVITPGGQAGSIGVIATHTDVSAMQEQLGVKTTVVSAGRYKAEGNPFAPLDDEARARMNEMVASYYTMFVKAVARGRAVKAARVSGGFGEGRILSADEAKSAGLVDRIATLEEVVAELQATGGCGSGARAQGPPSVYALKRQLLLEMRELQRGQEDEEPVAAYWPKTQANASLQALRWRLEEAMRD